MGSEPRIVVTISREMCSGGSYVGQQVARHLRFAYLDREILRHTASALGIDESEVESVEGRTPGFWEHALSLFALGSPEELYVPPPVRPIPDTEIQRVEARVMRQLAASHSCIIVGRGGFWLLRDLTPIVRVFLYAPRQFRRRRAMDLYDLSAEEADGRIDHVDPGRERFNQKLAGRSWYDARNYHLAVDTERVGFSETEEMIVTLVRRTRESG
jgi:cytidylate kinase